jgi:hypothetical protein
MFAPLFVPYLLPMLLSFSLNLALYDRFLPDWPLQVVSFRLRFLSGVSLCLYLLSGRNFQFVVIEMWVEVPEVVSGWYARQLRACRSPVQVSYVVSL